MKVKLAAFLSALAMTTSVALSQENKFVILPAGTTFEGRLETNIGSATSHAGERFTITMASPVLANGIDVLIPAGSQIVGEVVEAISSRSIPHDKTVPPTVGKLRIQLNSLRTTDGITYPLAASLAADSSQNDSGHGAGGVGYVGNAANFDAVVPGRQNARRGRTGRVLTKEEVMRDPIYGTGSGHGTASGSAGDGGRIRSLVRRGYDLYIDAGSPLTIRLNAPFKIALQQLNLNVPLEGKSDTEIMPPTSAPAEGMQGGIHRERQERYTQTHSEESKETKTVDTPF